MKTAIALALVFCLPSISAYADTIYRCRAYSGGVFWSQAHCNQRRALVETISTVPPGMSFDDQIRLAQAGENGSQRRRDNEASVLHKRTSCSAIDQEMQRIWKPYGEAQYVGPEQVGPDRIRWRDLEAKRNSLGCGR